MFRMITVLANQFCESGLGYIYICLNIIFVYIITMYSPLTSEDIRKNEKEVGHGKNQEPFLNRSVLGKVLNKPAS